MAKRYERKRIKVEKLKVQPCPLCPWDTNMAERLFKKSQAHGHRVLWFKCSKCTLEYQVRTWRDGDDVAKHFPYCPECGSKDASYCLKMDHELGRISEALHTARKSRA